MRKMRRVIACVVVGLWMASPLSAQEKTGFDISRNLEIFADIYRQLDMFYVDTLSADTAVRWAIDGMLQEIDPYTNYFPDDDQDALKTMATGRYAGIGAIIRPYKKEDRCAIQEPYEGSPAQLAGVRAGDIILTIDGKDTKGWPVAEVSKNLRGEPGTTFELRVQRQGEKKPLAFKITRTQIQTPAVPWYGIVDEATHTGYLYLSGVTDKCSRDVRYAIMEMRQQGMERLVLDLRNNPGGAIVEAVEIVGMFVPRGSLVVSTRGKVAASSHEYRTPAEPIDTVMPLAVLVNSGSASAAEIISGALQDLDRAVILGQRTYGKGLVQGIREVPYRGQLKITTARYYIPSGRCIQAYDYRHRTIDGAATTLPDSLTREFRTRLGRPVRDGGGILPDTVLVSDSVPSMVMDLYNTDVFFSYCNEYAAAHESIAGPGAFHLSDEDYAAFMEQVIASGFTYHERTVKGLEHLSSLARAEGCYESARAEFEQLEAKLRANDLRADLLRYRRHIQDYLEDELIGRYYFQRGALHHQALRDKEVRKAIESMNN